MLLKIIFKYEVLINTFSLQYFIHKKLLFFFIIAL